VAENLDRSLEFYRDGIGMDVVDEWDRPEDRAAVLSRGAGMLEIFAASSRHEKVAPSGVRLSVEVDDVPRRLERLRSAGFGVESDAETMPWGLVQAGVRDPDGLEVVLYSPAPAGDPTDPVPAGDPTDPVPAGDPTDLARADDPTHLARAGDPTDPVPAADHTDGQPDE